MEISYSNTPFQSKIKFINQSAFEKKVAHLNPKKYEVGYPWIPEGMKKGKKLFTRNFRDCYAGGIIDDENNTIEMFHLCTRNQKYAKSTKQKGFNIAQVERRLLEKINLGSENLHAFIMGGFQFKPDSKYNINKGNQIIAIFEKYNIPYTAICGMFNIHRFGYYSMLFDGKEDTIYITNSLTNVDSLGKVGKEIQARENLILYNKYEPVEDEQGVHYVRKRTASNLEKFLQTQFRIVKRCRFDQFM